MSLKLIAQASSLGVLGSSAYVSTIIDIDVPDNSNNQSNLPEISETQKKNFSTTKPETMTLEDVEMFEKDRGCKFAFVDGSKSYTVRDWFNKKMKAKPQWESHWRGAFAYGVYYYKNDCRNGEVLTLEPHGTFGGHFKPKVKF